VTLWGSGTPLREFMHVDDFAKAVVFCMDKYDDSKQINVGSGHEVSIKDLATKISAVVGFTGEIIWDSSKPDGTPRKVLDSSKIGKLGWKPLISLDQGIASTVEWYLQNK
jgi:GDP-L-fucose synthase